MSRDYVKKKRKGTESPQKVNKMQVKIKYHKHCAKNDPYYTDIIFKNSVEDIGSKEYVAHRIEGDKIYFRFFKELSHDDSDKYKFKMVLSNASDNIRTVNVCKAVELKKFWNVNWYPIYYLPSSDEYFIIIKDVLRRNLFTSGNEAVAEKSDDSTMRDTPLYSVIHDATYDAINEALFGQRERR